VPLLSFRIRTKADLFPQQRHFSTRIGNLLRRFRRENLAQSVPAHVHEFAFGDFEFEPNSFNLGKRM
jgi:hypothetical protein